MGFAKCYDVVEMVIDEATNQFGVLFNVDEERLQELKVCCSMIDMLAKKFDGISYEVEVDEDTADITVSLVCSEFEVSADSDDFYGLICKAKKVTFKSYEKERLQIDFMFSGIWVRAF